jgi:1H-pyrrole-2-carbonyl-[peptidyl-carrier protein] brominase
MRTQVAIVGGGPGGAGAAMQLARHGVETLIVEREEFPRYHIGESMTGECGGLLRELGLGDRMIAAGHPQKQGVRVFGKGEWFLPVMRRDGANQLEDQFTWQVRRSEFDAMMLDEAVARGAQVVRGRATGVLRDDRGGVSGLRVEMQDGGIQDISSDLVLDASGQKTFLAHQGVTSARHTGRYDKQIAIFSQVANTVRDGSDRQTHRDNTLIFYSGKYHWAWFIPLTDDVVSVGVVVDGAYFASKNESKKDFYLRELQELHPELARRVPDRTLLEEVRTIPNYSYFVDKFSGPGFLCLGDAHRFIDPIFSFGLYLTLKEGQLATPHILRYLNGETRHSPDPFAEHEAMCSGAMDVLQDLIDAFWEEPISFATLVSHPRTRPDMIDMFAGRVYMPAPSEGATSLNKIALKARGLAVAHRATKFGVGSRGDMLSVT